VEAMPGVMSRVCVCIDALQHTHAVAPPRTHTCRARCQRIANKREATACIHAQGGLGRGKGLWRRKTSRRRYRYIAGPYGRGGERLNAVHP
jgi:hypothetical protein